MLAVLRNQSTKRTVGRVGQSGFNVMSSEGKKLSGLLKGTGAKIEKSGVDPLITRLAIDSRRVTPGCLFFALPGHKRDGSSFIDEALSRGAVAVVSKKAKRLGMPRAVFASVDDPRLALAQVARVFYDSPDKRLELVGVTGTNGKTTVSYLLKHFLSLNGKRTGCLGTIGYDLVNRALPSFRTTPEAHDLCELLSQMCEYDCERAIMEVSSHGIDQLRLAGLEFDAALFLNLTRDHLDYHGDMESYFNVKRRFFTGDIVPVPKTRIINVDDPYGKRLAHEFSNDQGVTTFGGDEMADLRFSDLRLEQGKSTFKVHLAGRSLQVVSPLIGSYNVSNLLAALAACVALGEDIEECAESLESFQGIPGRMEKVDAGQSFMIVVDYAHTDDALRHALTMLREITPGKLKLVFGCGGDRDRGKRVTMTQAALELADHCWATADNPRSESQESIFKDMEKGVDDFSKIDFVVDRRRAIELAIKSSGEGDCILIAGKGHESFQEFGDTVVPFDDRLVAKELLELIKLGQHG